MLSDDIQKLTENIIDVCINMIETTVTIMYPLAGQTIVKLVSCTENLFLRSQLIFMVCYT